jgi:hypothetical protein
MRLKNDGSGALIGKLELSIIQSARRTWLHRAMMQV